MLRKQIIRMNSPVQKKISLSSVDQSFLQREGLGAQANVVCKVVNHRHVHAALDPAGILTDEVPRVTCGDADKNCVPHRLTESSRHELTVHKRSKLVLVLSRFPRGQRRP